MSTKVKVVQNGCHIKSGEVNRDELKKFATIYLGNNNNNYSLKKPESDLFVFSFWNCSKISFLLLYLFSSMGYYDSYQILLKTSSLWLNLQRMPSVIHRSMSDAPTVGNGNPGKADTPTGILLHNDLIFHLGYSAPLRGRRISNIKEAIDALRRS